MTSVQDQKNLFLKITTAAGVDTFILHKFEGVEQISELFEFHAELYSMTSKNAKALSMDFSTILEKDATITIKLKDNKTRHFRGIVTNIVQGATVGYTAKATDKKQEKTFFKITIRPKLWLLILNENCRIFQNKKTIAIIKEVLAEHQIIINDQTSNAGVALREYCVQYNESDFAFVSRLMEAEGIYYSFDHTETAHTLVLFDGSKPHKASTNAPSIKVLDPLVPGFMGIHQINMHQQIVSDAFKTKDYAFETPTVDLKAEAKGKTQLRKVYNYPGNYTVQATGETIAGKRLDAIEATESLISATSNVPHIMPGYTFKLLNALRKDLNNLDYVIFKATHYATYNEEDSDEDPTDPSHHPVGKQDAKTTYTNTFSCFPKTVKYRPLLKTPRPHIYGTQTAKVTGKDQEEIWTDKYGRVLVKFPWDLSDTKNEKTSCWIRVMLPWTGQGWGMQFVPRMGQEVVITFLNGDPDHPLITGCVYNGTNLPPYLPGEPTKSGIKTNTSKGGAGFNELRFEDKKDNEEVYIHAQKDLNIDVLNGNRTTTLKSAKNKPVTDTLKIIKGNRIKTLTEGDETVTLTKGKRNVTLTEGNDTLTLTKGNHTITLSKGDQSINITGNQTQDISKNCTLTIGGNLTIKVTGNISMESKAFKVKCTTFDVDSAGPATIKSATLSIKASATAEISAGATMTVKGEAQATFQSSAMVNVKGAMVNVEGSAMATLKGAMATVQGSAMGALKGGIVMIG